MQFLAKLAIFIASLSILTACTGGNGDFFSGHKVGINRSGQVLDIGDIRVELADMRSARNFPIPETRYMSFSWSPSGYRAMFDRNNFREPTAQDWQRYMQLRLTNTDWSSYGNPERARRDLVKFHQRIEAENTQSEYPNYVRLDGQISNSLCSGVVAGRVVCAGQLVLTTERKRTIAQMALDHFEPGCMLGVIDPPTVVRLAPNYKSTSLSLIVQVDCN